MDTIYEPIFDQYNVSFGFRPGLGTSNAMETIYTNLQGIDYVIEGAIKGAYDNVDYNILMNTLKKEISDNRFLKLIKSGLNAGILDKTKEIDTFNGIPQGGIASPTLFNIYMHQFDEYLMENLIPELTKNTTEDKVTTQYHTTKSRISRAQKKSQQLENTDPKIVYVRYAADWIIGIRGNREQANMILNKVDEFLGTIKLTLSREKTKVTNIKESKAKFLGYEIFYQRNTLIKKRTLNDKQVTQRLGALQIHPDVEWLENRFIQKKLLEPTTLKPRELGFLTILQDHEIIEKYNQFMIGLGNYYYRHLSYPSRINRWHYILYYSCIKTLATKHRLSTRKVIDKYGFTDTTFKQYEPGEKIPATDIRIVAHYSYNNESRFIVLYNYKEIMMRLKIMNRSRPTESIDFDPFQKINYRTQFKRTNCCAICSTEGNLHNYHIKLLKHRGGLYKTYKGFDKVIASLGRKQITVCSYCHEKIHKGLYDQLALDPIYDLRLVTPEPLIRIPELSTKTKNPGSENQYRGYSINYDNRTIFINLYNRFK